jgi:hypothetical protein
VAVLVPPDVVPCQYRIPLPPPPPVTVVELPEHIGLAAKVAVAASGAVWR